MKNLGEIYVHIPFCRNKCLYCDFYTGGVRIADWNKYVDAVLNEAQLRKEEVNFTPHTLYLGGGTPSLMPVENFIKLVEGLCKIFQTNYWREFTIEVNPEDVDERKINVWKRYGVNRISIGIQSLNDKELKKIGRIHDARMSLNAMEILKHEFDNISADIMFGLPGQTLDSYTKTLNDLIDTGIGHISSYSLMLEEGTALTHLWEKGKIKLPDEDAWIEMFHLTNKLLEEAGFKHYEISNFARDNKESIHNTGYWTGSPYLGLGAGAHSYNGNNIRSYNPNDLKNYIRFYENINTSDVNDKKELFLHKEILSEEERREEMIMTRLRTKQGLTLKEFSGHFGIEERDKLLEKSRRYIEKGLMVEKDENLALSEEGFILYNDIVASLI